MIGLNVSVSHSSECNEDGPLGLGLWDPGHWVGSGWEGVCTEQQVLPRPKVQDRSPGCHPGPAAQQVIQTERVVSIRVLWLQARENDFGELKQTLN